MERKIIVIRILTVLPVIVLFCFNTVRAKDLDIDNVKLTDQLETEIIKSDGTDYEINDTHVSPDSIESDDWIFDQSTGTLTCDKMWADESWKNQYDSEDIKKIILTNKVISIHPGAFSECSNLASINIPSSVQSIGDSAFYKCQSLQSVVIPASVKSIGSMAFYNCQSLKSVELSSGVEEILDYAFAYCDFLDTISLPSSVKKLGKKSISDSVDRIVLDGVMLEEEYALSKSYYDNNRNMVNTIIANKEYNNTLSVEFVSDGSDGLKRGGICGDISWTIDNNGVLRLFGEGDFEYLRLGSFWENKNGDKQFIPIIDNKWSRYSDEVSTIEISIRGIKSIAGIGSGFKKATAVRFVNCNFGNVESTVGAFSGCSSIKEFYMNGFEMPEVIAADMMFSNCPELETVNLDGTHMPNVCSLQLLLGRSGGDPNRKLKSISWRDSQIKNVTNMNSMFYSCSALEEIDLSFADTSHLVSCSSMFKDCTSLRKIDFSKFKTTNVVDYSEMFYNCPELSEIDLSGFDMSSAVYVDEMLDSPCIKKIITPFKTGSVVPVLPKIYYDETGKMYNRCAIPANANHSITLTKSEYDYITANRVTLNRTDAMLTVGDSIALTADVGPENAFYKTVYWESSDKFVAYVTNDGLVEGRGVGTAIITAYAIDGAGAKASCKVTVNDIVKVTNITLDSTEIFLKINNTERIKASVSPSNAANKVVKWDSSDPSVATVTQDGVIKGISSGIAIITVMSTDGSNVQSTCKVTVNKTGPVIRVTGITLKPNKITLKQGETAKLTYEVLPSNATNKNFTWKSSNKNVATIVRGGKVTAVSAGKATITATTKDGGYVASCKVTVKTKVTPTPTPDPKKIVISGATINLSAKSFTYKNKAQKPTVKSVVLGNKTLTADKDYTVSYSKKTSKNVGTYKVAVTGIGKYTGSVTAKYTIKQAVNPLKVSLKKDKLNVKLSNLKKKDQKVSRDKYLTVSKGQGTVTYKITKGNKSITIGSKNGKIKVKKGLKKGTYPINISIKAAGNKNYKASTKKITFKVVVK